MPLATRSYDAEQNGYNRRSRSPVDFKQSARKLKVRTAPPEQTNAESFYYLKQMNARTPMVFVMTDCEEIRGWIEWYDKNCLKVNREGAPNLLSQKHCVKYCYKVEE